MPVRRYDMGMFDSFYIDLDGKDFEVQTKRFG